MWRGQLHERKEHWLFYMAVFLCFFALYAVTSQRGVSWQDSGEFQYRILSGDYQWHSGIARAHPLYIVMAQGFAALFPKSACFYAANLFSGLGLALALALLAYNVMRLTRSVRSAVLAVSVLGFAHMAWWMGTIAEVYTWSLVFLMAEVLCLIRYSERRDGRWLIALFGANGAHWGIHDVALLGLPVYTVLLVSEVVRHKWRGAGTVCGCALLWVMGGGMVIWQAACLVRETGNLVLVMKSVLFGDGYERQVLGVGGFELKMWLANMALAGISFATPCWVFAGRGFFLREESGPSGVLNQLRALTVLHGVFWVRYFVPDQATFVLPTLGLLAVWVGLGCSAVCKDKRIYAILLTAGLVCAVAGPGLLCDAMGRGGLTVHRSRTLPFRDEMRYWMIPWKQDETSAVRFVEEAGKQLGAGDVLLADATAAGPLLAARAANILPKKWRLVTPWSGETDADVLALVRKRTLKVYAVSRAAGYAPKSLLEAGCAFEPEGILFCVK